MRVVRLKDRMMTHKLHSAVVPTPWRYQIMNVVDRVVDRTVYAIWRPVVSRAMWSS